MSDLLQGWLAGLGLAVSDNLEHVSILHVMPQKLWSRLAVPTLTDGMAWAPRTSLRAICLASCSTN